MRRSLTRSWCGTSSCFPRWINSHYTCPVFTIPSYLSSSIFTFFTCAPQVTRVDGDKLLPYRSDLVQILQLTLHLKCKQGYILACNLLHHILRSTALIYPTEYCSVPGGFHKPVSDYLPIKVLMLIESIITFLLGLGKFFCIFFLFTFPILVLWLHK